MEDMSCQRCGRHTRHLWLCEECRDDDTKQGRERLAHTIASCSKTLAFIMILCTQVIISGGQDKDSMARALRLRDSIGELDAALAKLTR